MKTMLNSDISIVFRVLIMGHWKQRVNSVVFYVPTNEDINCNNGNSRTDLCVCLI